MIKPEPLSLPKRPSEVKPTTRATHDALQKGFRRDIKATFDSGLPVKPAAGQLSSSNLGFQNPSQSCIMMQNGGLKTQAGKSAM